MRRLCLGMLGVLVFAAAIQAQPKIAAGGIFNATGYQPKLAPDTVFVVFGSGLGPAALAAASAPNYPASLEGTSITLTPASGGDAVPAKMIYTFASQIAGLLPSSITPGSYAVRVNYNGQTSPPETVAVVARSFGIASADSGGSGPAQATDGNVNNGLSLVRFTTGALPGPGFTWTLTPSHAGDTLVLWGTGGGADAANDTGGTSGDQTAAGSFTVTVEGRAITPVYSGASANYPGLWQINFTLPTDIPPDCYAPVQVLAGGEPSNLVTIAIALAGQSSCIDSTLSQETLAKLDAGGSATGAAFAVTKNFIPEIGSTSDSAAGGIYRWTASQWAASAPLRPNLGECRVYDRTLAVNGIDPSAPGSYLDAGVRLPLTGPNVPLGAGLVRYSTPTGPGYLFSPQTSIFASGTYTLTGSGGADVGSFTVATRFPDSFTVTNLAAIKTIDHTQPLTINWTGGGLDHVIMDFNSTEILASSNHTVTITCDVPSAPGTFTVPLSAVSRLPLSANGAIGIYGSTNPGAFTATLTAGGQLDFGSFGPNLGVSTNAVVK